MNSHLFLAIAFALSPTGVITVGARAPIQVSEDSEGLNRNMTPDGPAKPGGSEIPRSHMDAGMQHIQGERHDPHASMARPNRDPSMSTNPDVAPPMLDEGRAPDGTKRFQ